MSKALVFSIEEFSVFDGPGIRTSVFLKGCPLRCEWCHNPEGQSFENFILRSPNGCENCGRCESYAQRVSGKTVYTQDSINACPNNLLRYCAREYSAQELCEKLRGHFSILNSCGGGVTFSGGEPTSHPEFLIECLEMLCGGVNRAVQTSGYCSADVFCRVLENCDYMLFDIKLADDDLHIKYTGASNKNILENFKILAESGKDFVVRTPLIPTVTDTEENLRAIAELLRERGVLYIELMPYNKIAGSKYALLGESYSPSFDEGAEVQTRVEIFESYGIKTKIL